MAESKTTEQTAAEKAEEEKAAAARSAAAKKAAETRKANEGKVDITLSNPLVHDSDKVRLGLDTSQDYNAGDTVKVTVPAAQSIIGAGYACVNPNDIDAVRDILGAGVAADNVAATTE